MTRILITGDRRWDAFRVAETLLDRFATRYGAGQFVVVHGACPTGVDAAFDVTARRMGQHVEPHPAEWEDLKAPGAVIRRRRDGVPYNANAGPARNQRMIDAGAAFCVAIHRTLGHARGTRDCVQRALRAGIPVWWISSNECRPVKVNGFEGSEVLTDNSKAKAGQTA